MSDASIKCAVWMLIIGGLLELLVPARQYLFRRIRSPRALAAAIWISRWSPRFAYACGLAVLVWGFACVP